MALSLQITIVLVALSLGCHAAKIKYILRSGAGSLDSDPDFFENKWPREIHSIAGSSSNSIHTATEAPLQDCELNGSCGEMVVDGYSNLEATFKPFPQDHLNKILQKFTNGDSSKLANVYVDRNDNIDEIEHTDNQPEQIQQQPEQQSPQAVDKSKSWNLVNQQHSQHSSNNNNNNKHPYDDRQGWVTLEPIAWSSSQIQKWEPNPRPTFPSPNEAANYNWNGPSSSKPPYGASSERPWNKPSYEYNTKPQWGNKPAQWSANQNYEYKPTYSSGGSWGGNSDIITDNRPGSFPTDNRPSGSHDSGAGYRPWGGSSPPTYNKQPSYNYGGNSNSYASSSSERPSYSSTADGDGHWVLLSSTKGYSIPQRHRSNSRSMNLAELEKSELPKTIIANVVNSS